MTLAHPDPVTEELAVRDLLDRFADAVCRQDVTAVADLFTADGVWSVTGHGQPTGRAEIATFLADLLEHWSTIVHGYLSGRIRLDPTDPDRATGRWYIEEFGEKSGTEVFFAGVYHDEYVREAGLWRFSRRRFDSMFRRIGATVTTSPFPVDAPAFP